MWRTHRRSHLGVENTPPGLLLAHHVPRCPNLCSTVRRMPEARSDASAACGPADTCGLRLAFR
ncbi:unnamed protein product, partial [Musa textilis]